MLITVDADVWACGVDPGTLAVATELAAMLHCLKHATQRVPRDTDRRAAPAVGRHNIAPTGGSGVEGDRRSHRVPVYTESAMSRSLRKSDGTFLRVILGLAADLLAREIG
jgi:hypothetical protein